MLPRNHPDRIQIAFDDPRLVANAGLILPVTLAGRLDLSQLVDNHVDLGDAPGRANTGDKILTLVASALAGGDCIDDTDVLRAGRTSSVLGCVVKAPSTLGTFLRSFRWGHVRQLDRVKPGVAGARLGRQTGEEPLIDIVLDGLQTYGLAKEGARHHNYTGQRGYLLAVAAGTGDVRLRKGRANTARGAANAGDCPRVPRERSVRADSGDLPSQDGASPHRQVRNLMGTRTWTPIPYWMDGAADRPFTLPSTVRVRLIGVKQLPTALHGMRLLSGFITFREGIATLENAMT